MIQKQPTQKVTLGSLDTPSLTVTAQYNPAELSVALKADWKAPAGATQAGAQQGGAGASGGGDDEMALEFTGIAPRDVSIALLFDGVEGVGKRGVDVSSQVAMLELLASPRDPKGTTEDKRRPHHCVLIWPNTLKLQCVIQSVTTNYQMFDHTGKPLRATCTVVLKETKKVSRTQE